MAWNSIIVGCASRPLAVPLAALVLLTTAAGVPPAANPAAPIAAAAGHPAGRHLVATAHHPQNGQDRTETLEVDGSQRLVRDCSAGLCSGNWFDGRHRAAFGFNGGPFPDRTGEDPAERTFAAIASTAFGEPAFGAAGGTVEAVPAGADGRLRYRVNARQGAPLVAVADAATNRLIAVELPDGTLFRRLHATSLGTTIVYADRTYDTVRLGAAPIVVPSRAPITVGDPSVVPLLSDALPIVPCRLAGFPASCLIDTGSTPSAVTLSFAEKLGREPYGTIEIAGLGSYLTGVVDAGPLVIGSASLDTLHFAVIPHDRGAHFDVIVGSDALSGIRLDLDPGHRRVTIGASRTQPAGTSIPLDFVDGLPFIPVRLAGGEHTQAMLVDTGDTEFLSIGYDQYRKDMSLFTVRSLTSASGLGGSAMDAVRGEIARADVGPESADRVAIVAVRGQHAGHVGYGFASWCARLSLELGQGRIECAEKPTHP